jgi:hypothetical protein
LSGEASIQRHRAAWMDALVKLWCFVLVVLVVRPGRAN